MDVTLQTVELAVLSTFTDVCDYDTQASAMLSTEGDPDFQLARFSYDFPQSSSNQCHLDDMAVAEPELQAQMDALVNAQTIVLELARQSDIIREFNVLATLDMGWIILGISGLSFLGLGAQPPTPEWGAMLNDGRPFLQTAPQMMLYPGSAIFLVVLGFNLLGDGLRDILDPTFYRR